MSEPIPKCESEPLLSARERWWLKIVALAVVVGLLYGFTEWATQFVGLQSQNVATAVGVFSSVAYLLGRLHERGP